ncbi:ABC transporter permease [Terracidiphilus gabretensis]|uniref:ABC transporter permease n=1 Tax=Terracidiphilus gabretensis TaxID=1577687 RepID=UPI00071B0E19|nr:ABC transporter permease [Terracidiphilus gabretensis]
MLQDLRHALRRLRSAPGFTVVVVLMLALGIGANTAVFSVMNAILMQLLPVSRPDGLFYMRMANGEGQPPGAGNTGDSDTSFSDAAFESLRQRSDVFEELIAYVPLSFDGSVPVRHGELPEEADGEAVSGNFFSGLSARLAQGRGFTLDDEKKHTAVVVLSYDYWTRSFARDSAGLGQTLYIKGVPMTVVGVAARGFHGIDPGTAMDFWVPLQNRPELNAWGSTFDSLYGSPKWWALPLMARLRPGVSPAQAQQALTGTFGEVARQAVGTIDPKKWKPLLDFVEARGVGIGRDGYRKQLQVLMGLVVLVLLIACTNVAMLMQARTTARQREFSVRLAIGASRSMILRSMLWESGLLVAAGAVFGWVFALAATRALAAWSEIETGLSPDRTVLFFTLAVSCVAALTFAFVPYWTAIHAPVNGVLRSSSNNVTESRARAMGGRFVLAAQMAVCLVLLMVAGLLLRTLRNYATQQLGLETQGLVVFGVTPQGKADAHLFYRTLMDRIRQMPGVESVSMAGNRPGSGWSNNNDLAIDGAQKPDTLRSNDVGPDFFRTMGVPVLNGRDIAQSDIQDRPLVAVVNETLVKKFLANTNPMGHVLGSGKRKFAIVGVVRDSKYRSVDETPMPMAYYAAMQSDSLGTMHIEVRVHGDAAAALPEMRRVVASLDPNVPLEKPMTQQEQFDKSYEGQKMFAAMGGFFGGLSALLVAVGLYGMHSFRVSRKTTEIGVRMALGASRWQVLTMVLRESLWILLAGLVAGIPLTLLAVRPLRAMLYQMSPFDPMSFALAIAAMFVVAMLATVIPARRAASIEPMQALRTE